MGGPHRSHSSISLCHSVLFVYIQYISIYFFQASVTAQHIAIINNTNNGEGEQIKRRVNDSRKPTDTPSWLRVVVMFFPLPPAALCVAVIEQAEGRIKSLFCYQNAET